MAFLDKRNSTPLHFSSTMPFVLNLPDNSFVSKPGPYLQHCHCLFFFPLEEYPPRSNGDSNVYRVNVLCPALHFHVLTHLILTTTS